MSAHAQTHEVFRIAIRTMKKWFTLNHDWVYTHESPVGIVSIDQFGPRALSEMYSIIYADLILIHQILGFMFR